MKQIVKESVSMFVENFYSIITISFPYIILSSILDNFTTDDSGAPAHIVSIISVVLISIFLPIFILFLSRVLMNNTWTIKDIVFRGMLYSPSVFIVNCIFLMPLFIAVIIISKLPPSFILFFSLLLAVVAVVISIKISFSNFLIVLENKKPIEAIKNSFVYTNEYSGKIFSTIVVLWIPIGFLSAIIDVINFTFLNSSSFVGIIGNMLINTMFLLVYIALFKIYSLNYFQRYEIIKQNLT